MKLKRSHIDTPKLAGMILQVMLKDHLYEEVTGDLEERYHSVLKRKSVFRARLDYWYQVFNYLRPFAIRRRKSNSNTTAMFKHNLVLTIRNFRKFKSQFLINLIGLSTGLACVLFIYLWVNDEIQIDKFHNNKERLYQVMSNHEDASGIFTWKGVPGLLLEEIQTTIPDVQISSAYTDSHEYTLSSGNTYFKANGKFASKDFLKVFSFPLKSGDPNTVLNDPNSIVITRSLATRIFNSTDVIGRNLEWHFWGKTKSVQIAGVLEDLPSRASERFDFLMSWNYYHNELVTYKHWFNYYGRVAIVLGNDSEPLFVEEKIDAILKEKQGADNVDLFIAKYSDRYLYSKYENGKQAGGRVDYVNLFSIIAIFILIIACINFVNLSTAKASHRVKEIGIKKSIGASRRSIISQFFIESFLLTFFSMILAVVIVWFLLPAFSLMTSKELSLTPNMSLIAAMLLVLTVVSILSGFYPALYHSAFSVLSSLKGKQFLDGRFSALGRRSLVVIQFSFSIILIVSVIVVFNQMEFIQNKNLGFNKNNLLYFEREGKLIENHDAFLKELRNTPGVVNASVSGFMVGGGNSTGGVSWEGKTPEDQIQFWETQSGVGLIELLDLEIVQGRSFSDEFRTDTAAIIFNETAIKAMGLNDPIGKTITHYNGERKIIGVVKDFHLLSLHTNVEPMLFLYDPQKTHFIMARLENSEIGESITRVGDLYETFNPGYVFKPEFIDQDFESLYAAEERVAVLSKFFAGIAILISCLGLFGLAAFTAERKTKEIGIRKVMGASSKVIVYILSRDFTKMVLYAIIISIPISYFMTSRWLENFAYAIELKWWFFVLSAIGAVLIAWITIGFQTYRAATINPSECLRDE